MNFPEDDAPDMITATELRNLKDICSLLGPMEVLTKELSVEKSVMSSKVLPLINGIGKLRRSKIYMFQHYN